MHRSASANEDTLEFVSSVGDSVTVNLTDDERRELLAYPTSTDWSISKPKLTFLTRVTLLTRNRSNYLERPVVSG